MRMHPLNPGYSIHIQTKDPNDTASFRQGKEAAEKCLAELNIQIPLPIPGADVDVYRS